MVAIGEILKTADKSSHEREVLRKYPSLQEVKKRMELVLGDESMDLQLFNAMISVVKSAYLASQKERERSHELSTQVIDEQTAAQTIANNGIVGIDLSPVEGLFGNGMNALNTELANYLKNRKPGQELATVSRLGQMLRLINADVFPPKYAEHIKAYQEAFPLLLKVKEEREKYLRSQPEYAKMIEAKGEISLKERLKELNRMIQRSKEMFPDPPYFAEHAREIGQVFSELIELSGIHLRVKANEQKVRENYFPPRLLSADELVQIIVLADSRISPILRQLEALGIDLVYGTSANITEVQREPFSLEDFDPVLLRYLELLTKGELDRFFAQDDTRQKVVAKQRGVPVYNAGVPKHEGEYNASYPTAASQELAHPDPERVYMLAIRHGNLALPLTQAILKRLGIDLIVDQAKLKMGTPKFVHVEGEVAEVIAEIGQRNRVMALLLYQSLQEEVGRFITDQDEIQKMVVGVLRCLMPIEKP